MKNNQGRPWVARLPKAVCFIVMSRAIPAPFRTNKMAKRCLPIGVNPHLVNSPLQKVRQSLQLRFDKSTPEQSDMSGCLVDLLRPKLVWMQLEY